MRQSPRTDEPVSQRDLDRFWAKVDKNGPVPEHAPHLGSCWQWLAYKHRGYGQFCLRGRMDKASRASFLIHYGHWPRPHCLHHCDNPSCVNPAHLFEGDDELNQFDKIRKGRWRCANGERNFNAKLTRAQVLEIRAAADAGEKHALVAARFGIDKSTVSLIGRRKKWTHLQDEELSALRALESYARTNLAPTDGTAGGELGELLTAVERARSATP